MGALRTREWKTRNHEKYWDETASIGLTVNSRTIEMTEKCEQVLVEHERR